MQVLVTTFLATGDQKWFPDSAKIINWPGTSSDRKWLQSHMHHCMMNNKRVTLNPSEGNR